MAKIKPYLIGALVGLLVGAAWVFAIARDRESKYIDALTESKLDVERARDAATRAEARYAEIASRFDSVINGANSSASTAGRIAGGLDGDAQLTRLANREIQSIIDGLQTAIEKE